MFRKMIGTAVLFCFESCLLAAQVQPEARELLQKVSDVYKRLDHYHFEALTVVEVKSDALNQRMEMPMVLAASKPGKSRIEMKNPMFGLTLVSDGKTTWTYVPRLGQFTKKAAAQVKAAQGAVAASPGLVNDTPLTQYAKIPERLKSARTLRQETLELGGQKIDTVVVEAEIDRPQSGPSVVEISPSTLWIDKSRFVVLREQNSIKMKNPFGSGMMETAQTTTFSVTKIGAPLPESLFTFNPPPEAKEVAELDLPGFRKSEWVGKEAVDFKLKDMGGKEISLKSLRGNVVLIDFWASWCGPCRQELPHIEKLHRELKGKGLIVLGVNDEERQVAEDFVRKNNYTFTNLMDEKNEVNISYRVTSIPMVFIVDREGKIASHFVGARSESELRSGLKQAGIE
ncbi:MAG TPA: redoxin domain-containing protein [Acidobacteriota bacterium]|jgi:peroxiredoxin/outer membrane lipoprotein-sorting protein